MLREVSSKLIDIHSQHQNLLLSNEDFLLDTLDSVAGNQALIGEYHTAFQAWHQAEHTLRQLQQTAHQQESDREFWEFQLAQIDEAQLQEDEQAQLEEESKTLEHAEDIKSACYQAVGFLRNDEHDVVQLLRSAKSALEGAARYMGGLDELTERLSSARIELDDVLSEIETKAEEVDFDPERLLWVNDRLSTIYSLEKKHQVSEISELLAIAEDLRQRLSAIDNADARIAAAETEVKRTFAAVTALGAQRHRDAPTSGNGDGGQVSPKGCKNWACLLCKSSSISPRVLVPTVWAAMRCAFSSLPTNRCRCKSGTNCLWR